MVLFRLFQPDLPPPEQRVLMAEYHHLHYESWSHKNSFGLCFSRKARGVMPVTFRNILQK